MLLIFLEDTEIVTGGGLTPQPEMNRLGVLSIEDLLLLVWIPGGPRFLCLTTCLSKRWPDLESPPQRLLLPVDEPQSRK